MPRTSCSARTVSPHSILTHLVPSPAPFSLLCPGKLETPRDPSAPFFPVALPFSPNPLARFPLFPSADFRQNDQAVESIRQADQSSRGEQPLGWQPARRRRRRRPAPTPSTPHDHARQHHRCGPAQSVRQCARLPHQLDQRQLGRGDVHLGR